MGRPKKEVKAKRNLFTLTTEAQEIVNDIPLKEKSKAVSQAIIKQLMTKNQKDKLIALFSIGLRKHFKGAKVNIVESNVKVTVEQLSLQDVIFLNQLYLFCKGVIGLNVQAIDGMTVVTIGLNELIEIPQWLKSYNREQLTNL